MSLKTVEDAQKRYWRKRQPLRGVRFPETSYRPVNHTPAPEAHTEAEGYSDPFPWEARTDYKAAKFLASVPPWVKKKNQGT